MLERSGKSRKSTRSGRFKRSVRSVRSKNSRRFVKCESPEGLQRSRRSWSGGLQEATVQHNFTQIKLCPIFKKLCKYNFAEIRYLGYLIYETLCK